MSATRWMAAIAFSALVTASMAGAGPSASGDPVTVPAAGPGQLSVMTYNVEGLPFPAAFNRTGSLQQIGMRLAHLREAGRQPHVLLLQEAFTPEAKAIVALSGYRYVAYGPQLADVASKAPPAMPAAFRAQAAWNKGESEGKWVDSGLVVLSDYPIVRTARMAFAPDACAGYDCLAAKGVLLTWIAVPGQAEPIAIADAHFNSRRATGVSNTRSNAAYIEQAREARGFIAANVPSTTSVVFGGDFNMGHDPLRHSAIESDGTVVGGSNAAEAIASLPAISQGHPLSEDVRAVVTRAKDVQFFKPGSGDTLRLVSLGVPFGIKAGGFSLSDHLGYVAIYGYQRT